MKDRLISLTPLILGTLPAVNATELGSWLLCGACVLVILNQGADFWRKNLKEKPAPADTYVNKTVCKILHAEVGKEFSEQTKRSEKIEIDIAVLRQEELRGIHVRINEILKAVSRLEGPPK